MCGICGFWHPGGKYPLGHVAESMAKRIVSRGPDDQGVWLEPSQGLALSHRRLSILDLSVAGHQPMQSRCGRFVIVYNGEIYNHLDLRKSLGGVNSAPAWRGHSDTETLLMAISQWGVRETLKKLNGMFAFALWDRQKKILTLARDRVGEKPLYYGTMNGVFLFASELKAMSAHPRWSPTIDRNALALFMRHNYVPAPFSIYEGIYKLLPGHYVEIHHGNAAHDSHCYWDLADVARPEQAAFQSPEEVVEQLDVLLRDAVAKRMAADVPLGAFLSGGYDSTAISALMQIQSSKPIKTFSIGFKEKQFDEACYAKQVAAHLGTDHTELYVTPEEAMEVIPNLPGIYDEPFADSSQIPTYLVSQLARTQVTVALSGDGGDELFCGYNRYVLGYDIWRRLSIFPKPLRQVASAVLRNIPRSLLSILDQIQANLPSRFRVSNLYDRLPKLAEVLSFQESDLFYRSLVSHWQEPEKFVLGSTEPRTRLTAGCVPSGLGAREQMMFLDTLTYLPDDILVKVDRATMAVGLEARVPFLDHRLIEFAWRVPIHFKYCDGLGKWPIRELVHRYVPRTIMDRPKMGFAVPIEAWLSGPLREWAGDLLNARRLRDEGFFDPNVVQNMFNEHVKGERRWHYHLWEVLMFQAWLDAQKGSSSSEFSPSPEALIVG